MIVAKSQDYRYWLYEHPHETSGSYLDGVSRLIPGSNIRINVLLVTATDDLKKELKKWTPEKFDVEIKNTGAVLTMAITRTISDERKITVEASAVRHPAFPAVYMIVSDCTTQDFKMVITKMMDKHYPAVSQIYLTDNEMKIIFDRLQQTTNSAIVVAFSVSKKRLPKSKKRESQITYTNQPYAEVFEEILSHDQWVHSIRYKAEAIEKNQGRHTRHVEFSGIISRSCFFSCKGDFHQLNKTIIPNAIKLASARNEHLRASAESAKERKPEPVVIKFDEQIFGDVSMNQRYIDALVKLESCSVSEYHTNPYIHVSVLDYRDGSSYDIWVLGPGQDGDNPAIQCQFGIVSKAGKPHFERIHEGTVKKYEQIEVNAES